MSTTASSEPLSQPATTPAALSSPPLQVEGGLALLDERGVILDANAALAAGMNRCLHDLIGQPLEEVLAAQHTHWRQAWACLKGAAGTFARAEWTLGDNAADQAWRFEVELTRHPAGKLFRIHSRPAASASQLEDECERCLSARPARRRSYFRLLRASEQLRQLMQRWPGVVFHQKPDGAFYFVSPRIEEFTGVPIGEWEQNSERFWQVIHEADLSSLQQRLKQAAGSPQPVTSTFRVRHLKTGKVAYILEHRQAVTTASGLLLGYEGVWLDLTRQTLVEKRLNAASWKETLSALMMGLAHDFRNIMTGIIGLTEAFQARSQGDDSLQQGLSLIKSNAWQAAQSIQRILQLYQGKSGERSYADLNELVTDLAEMTQKMLSRQVDLETRLAADPLPIYLDTFEFRQAFLNLAVNARDAMPKGGQLTITTSRHVSLPELKQVQGVLPRVPAICLTFSDSGSGIAPEHLGSLFDPFFTTKGLDKGSGLGLYNVLLFVEKHHGAVSVESVPGHGATFQLWFPEADFTEAEAEEPAGAGPLVVFGAPGPPLDSLAELLRRHHFELATVHDADTAFELLRSPRRGYAAVILQTTAPCPALLARLRQEDLPVKRFLHVVGCNQDELDTSLLCGVDGVLSPGMAGAEIAQTVRGWLSPAP